MHIPFHIPFPMFSKIDSLNSNYYTLTCNAKSDTWYKNIATINKTSEVKTVDIPSYTFLALKVAITLAIS